MTHDNIGDRWDKANIHDFRGTFGGYVRERVDVQILQPQKSASISTPASISPR
ncbi:hypothetical protein [Nostoc sp. FACHB-888]|uniref:hypothetical protein n=1 Tax=Nostoc sp. FACHB-888 TaxID=2692842 RepID=UPI0016857E47|nr:hypothetical protein [Nostoc sp. FACHB-888]MBD2244077.1 hypothetical protein [Nostoc sp. FACHB-888]